jgi:tubulin-specific chaperone D
MSSFEYFRWLLDLQTHDWLNLPFFTYEPSQWHIELFEGLVTSADTGSEDLIRVSRAALADFSELGELKVESSSRQGDAAHFVCEGLFQVAKKNITNDRVLVPTLEVMSYLFDVGIMQRSKLQ